jgi:hypothetical protein
MTCSETALAFSKSSNNFYQVIWSPRPNLNPGTVEYEGVTIRYLLWLNNTIYSDYLTSLHTKLSNDRVLRTFQESVPYCREVGNHNVAVNKLHREVNYCKMQVFQSIPFRAAMHSYLKKVYAPHRLLTTLSQ